MSFKDLPTDAQMADADDLWNARGLEMSELFSNDVPHVKGERVIKPTGLPPSDWSLA
jgi:hypothetical protein